jgi:uncharacterized membrane protein YsdA (DUF1294 family)/cold shock CspA family protein
MRTRGKITHWNAEKAYGFITPTSGAKQVFLHIRGFSNKAHVPEINQQVTFALSTDKQGRPCAVRVVLTGEAAPDKFKRNDSVLLMGGAIAFLIIVGFSYASSAMPVIVPIVYLVSSVLVFFIYWMDKSAARAKNQRTPENTLHLLALLGGWPGAMIAQQLFRHKTTKKSFRVIFWVTVLANCAMFVWLFTPSGGKLLLGFLY